MPPLVRNTFLDFDVSPGPTGITFGNGKFWTVTYGVTSFSKYNEDGTADGTVSHSSRFATGVVFHNDKLYVVDSSSIPRVAPYTQTGTAEATWLLHSDNRIPGGIAFGDNHFWVVDYNSSTFTAKIFKYTESGTFVAQYTINEDDIGTASGIVYIDGALFVTDPTSNIVLECSLTGDTVAIHTIGDVTPTGQPLSLIHI